jgi:hypothetical protein
MEAIDECLEEVEKSAAAPEQNGVITSSEEVEKSAAAPKQMWFITSLNEQLQCFVADTAELDRTATEMAPAV